MADSWRERPAHQATGAAQQRHDGSRGASDVAVARAIAGAARSVPGVTGLSRGHSALAATYGPTGIVTGVVVHRESQTPDAGGGEKKKKKAKTIQSPGETRIEVHVTVDATAAALSSAGNAPSGMAATEPGKTALVRTLHEDIVVGFLPAIAAEIRSVVLTAAQNMGLPAYVAVDVFIDDLD